MFPAGKFMSSLPSNRRRAVPASAGDPKFARQRTPAGKVLPGLGSVSVIRNVLLAASSILSIRITRADTATALSSSNVTDTMSLSVTRPYIDEGATIKIVGAPLYNEPLAVAVDKGSQLDPQSLVDKLSEIIEEMHDDGTLSEMSMKWYGADLTKEESSS